MKILHINSMPVGSTGKIMVGITEVARKDGFQSIIAFPEFDGKLDSEDKVNKIIIGNYIDSVISHIMGRITGYNDCFSVISTKIFLNRIKKLKPDLIHLHNLHNCYLYLPGLFNYIKHFDIPVVWTLHDCWAFTGKCTYFDTVQCEKWKNQCYDCPQLKKYPVSYRDKSNKLFKMKKENFQGISQAILVTPSCWLYDKVKKSFLKEYDCRIIYNGINLNIFKPTKSKFKDNNKLNNKFIVLGVAQKWDERKGLDIFIELYKNLDLDFYKIVLVGISDKQRSYVPEGILCIKKTNNQSELAEIYSAADVFVNPTREEMLGMVNLEALACGTPVITFNSGGSPECIDSSSGIVLYEKSCLSIKKALEEISTKTIDHDYCIKRAQKFDEQKKYKEYVGLYRELLSGKE